MYIYSSFVNVPHEMQREVGRQWWLERERKLKGSPAKQARNPPPVKNSLEENEAAFSPTCSSTSARAPSSSRYKMRRGKNRKEKIEIQNELAKAEPRSTTHCARPRPEHHLIPKTSAPHAEKQATRRKRKVHPPRNVRQIAHPSRFKPCECHQQIPLLPLALPPSLHKIIPNRDRNPNGLQESNIKKETPTNNAPHQIRTLHRLTQLPSRQLTHENRIHAELLDFWQEKEGRNDVATVCAAIHFVYAASNGDGICSKDACTRQAPHPAYERRPWCQKRIRRVNTRAFRAVLRIQATAPAKKKPPQTNKKLKPHSNPSSASRHPLPPERRRIHTSPHPPQNPSIQ
ncbi:hypothetical protein B0H13DRAFT_1889530 [Mycena leptocephala]|nr:hypothetical protein B0H13DRAFT_1889530 [Mycena leptocephala]